MEFYLVSRYARATQSLIAALLGGVAVGLLNYLPPDAAEIAVKPKSTHIAIPKPLFDIAESVCKNNGGYRSVTVERKSDTFTFTCADGLMLKDTLVRVM